MTKRSIEIVRLTRRMAAGLTSSLCLVLVGMIVAALPVTAQAEDIQVFSNPNAVGVTPNVVFALDLSDSMNNAPDGTNTVPTRLDIVKDSLVHLLNDPDIPDVNVGFTYFRGSNGSGIKFPAASIDSDASLIDPAIPVDLTVGNVIERMVGATSADRETPSVDSLYEIARYYRGEGLFNGRLDQFGTWDAAQEQYTGGSGGVPDGWRAANPASYTGRSQVYLPLSSNEGSVQSCNNRSISSPLGSDECRTVRDAGAPMACRLINEPGQPARECSSTQCDTECNLSCASGQVHTQPANCATRANGEIWVTRLNTDGQPRQCCSKTDVSGSECLAVQEYPSTCAVQGCTGSEPYRPPTVREYCEFRVKDTRQYISPISRQCQKSTVVLLTDGAPSSNTVDHGEIDRFGNAAGNQRIREMIASSDPTKTGNDVACQDLSGHFDGAPGEQPYGNCAKELVEYLNTENQVPSIEGSTVSTYTIGFGLTGPGSDATWAYLQDVAAAGGGKALEANDTSSLVDAFESVISNLSGSTQNFTGFATTMNINTLQTSDKVFLPLFSPGTDRAWDGNVKGYFLRNGELIDVNGREAIALNPSSGDVEFKPGARSFWSKRADGKNVLEGGLIDQIKPTTRDIYVNTSASNTRDVNLSNGNYHFNVSNAELMPDRMGMAANTTLADRADMINWVRSARVGAPLHATPTLISYSETQGDVLFITTTQGLLHAIDVSQPEDIGGTSGGDELFAYMPYQILDTLQAQRADEVSGSFLYGLDGPMTSIIIDTDLNRLVDATGDRAYIYFGMRRGGRSYYALDVTNPRAPRQMWQIDGGTPGFARLGQSWSKMAPAVIQDGASERNVLIFGGGYDAEKQDALGVPRDPAGDDVGMGLYVVDAETGALLMSIGSDDPTTPTAEFRLTEAQMRYSIPADIRTEDTNNNGIVDRLYAADTGGQVWRVDIVEGGSASSATTYSTHLLADLSGPGIEGNRRFYYPPSVALATRDGQLVSSLAIGSGFRAQPLNSEISDEFYVLFDPNVASGAPTTAPPPVTPGGLYDATSNVLRVATGAARDAEIAALISADGWRVTLPQGQKVLSRSRTFKNNVFFNTFDPNTQDTCDFERGTNRFYALSLFDAVGVLEVDVDNDGELEDGVRSQEIVDSAAIVSEPTIATQLEEPSGTTSNTFCSTVFAGSTAAFKICDAPVRVNWQAIQ